MPTDITQFAIPAAAFLVGFLISFLLLKSKSGKIKSSLESELSELREQLKDGGEELAYETHELMAAIEKIEELGNQKRDLETGLAASDREVAKIPQLETERDDSRKKENELQEKVNELSDQLTELSQKQDDGQKFEDELAEQKAKVAELDKTIQDFKEKVAENEDKLSEHQKLERELEEQNQKITALEATITDYSEKIAASDSVKDDHKKLTEELDEHKAKIAKLEQTLRDTEEELEQNFNDYEAQLAESNQKQNQKDVAVEQDLAAIEIQNIINEFSAKLARGIVQEEKA